MDELKSRCGLKPIKRVPLVISLSKASSLSFARFSDSDLARQAYRPRAPPCCYDVCWALWPSPRPDSVGHSILRRKTTLCPAMRWLRRRIRR